MYSLIWAGHFWHPCGFSQVAYNYARVLRKYLNLMLFPLPSAPSPFKEEEFADILDLINYEPAFDNNITVIHTTYLLKRINFKYRIGYTVAEGTKPLPNIARDARKVDEVWVPSRFTQEAFSRVNIDSYVIPHGVDTNLFRPRENIFFRSRFRFLSVQADTYRKGRDILIKAFTSEFKPKEKVELYIKTNQPSQVSDERIIFDCRVIPRSKMPDLYRAAHAFVLATRGESYLLPYAEAGACGLPVIATNWSGHLDYLNSGNSFLIDIKAFKPIPGVPNDIVYAEPDIKSLRELMRYVFENYFQAKKKALKLREDLVKNHTWEHGAEIILDRIKEIYAGM